MEFVGLKVHALIHLPVVIPEPSITKADTLRNTPSILKN
jgi:hypothetical protein